MNDLNRRALLAGLGMAAASHRIAMAEQPPITTIGWADLVPQVQGEGAHLNMLKQLGQIEQGQVNSWARQPPVEMVTTYNERLIRIPGYVVPLTLDGQGVTEGLLVPYVGACIHVPPPPANQIVFIQFNEPTPQDGLWDPVWATGRFKTAAVSTDLAEAGYVMTETKTVAHMG
jgi:hypothetical protein